MSLAGPAGAVVGTAVGYWLQNYMPSMQDILQEALGGLAGDQLRDLPALLQQKLAGSEASPLPAPYRNRLQEALRHACQEGVADVAGNDCGSWPRRPTHGDTNYPNQFLQNRAPELFPDVCQFWQSLYDVAGEWFPASSSTTPIPATESWQNWGNLSSQWLQDKLDPFLADYTDLLDAVERVDGRDIYNIRRHIQRRLYPRINFHLGAQLDRDVELWRQYSQHFQQTLLQLLATQHAEIDEKLDQMQADLATFAPAKWQISQILCSLTALTDQINEQQVDWNQCWSQITADIQQLSSQLTVFKEEIKEKLDRLMQLKLPGEWVDPQNIIPSNRQTTKVVIGQQIELAHLRRQQLMPRRERIEAILPTLKAVQQAHRQRQEDEEPVLSTLWIHGRSGTGKSVLLLQLMQHIILHEKQAHILWLQDDNDALPTVIDRWPYYQVPDNVPVYIFIDDFYTLQARAELDLTPISRALRRSDSYQQNWPILITCSPTEHFTRFEETRSDKIVVQNWRLDPIEQEEFGQIRQWYQQHTQKREPVSTGTAFAESEGLFMSMMAELDAGSLREFAQRFRQRIPDSLKPILTPILALNRLYLWPPASWLTDQLTAKEKDDFARLNQDRDFTLNQTEDARGNIRLTHPHLSDAIYRALRPDSEKHERSEDLIQAFKQALTTMPTFASLLLNRIVKAHELASEETHSDFWQEQAAARIYAQCAHDDLRAELWEIWQEQYPQLSAYYQVWFWSHWATWIAVDQRLQEKVSQSDLDPWQEAINNLYSNHNQFGILWQNLWEIKPIHLTLCVRGEQWLSQRSQWDNLAWAHVWQTLIQTDDLPNNIDRYQLLIHGYEWLNGRDDRNEWAHVWQTLIQTDDLPNNIDRYQLLIRGYEWLKDRDDRNEWSYVWRTLIETDDLPIQIDRQQLLIRGFEWLDDRDDRNDWSFVWQKIAEYPLLPATTIPPQDLFLLGYKWLLANVNATDWFYIWRTLIQTDDLPNNIDRQQLLIRGYEWLNDRDDRNEWSYVWQTLIQTDDLPNQIDREQLLLRGFEWLDGRDDRSEWFYVWRTLIQTDDLPNNIDRQQLLLRGFEWFNDRDGRSEWFYVWRTLIQTDDLPNNIDRQQLLLRGFEWLDGRDERNEWSHVWRTLIQTDDLPNNIDCQQLLLRGFEWLNGRDERDEWPFVWQICLEVYQSGYNEQAKQLLWQYHKRQLSKTEFWQQIKQLKSATYQKNIEIGFGYLRNYPQSDVWNWIWITLKRHSVYLTRRQQKALCLLAAQWLQDTLSQRDNPQWSYIYEEFLDIWPRQHIHPTIFEWARTWVGQQPEATSEIYGVAEKTLKWAGSRYPRIQSDGLIQFVINWLQHRLDDPSWEYGFEALWGVWPDMRVFELYLMWLASPHLRPKAAAWLLKYAITPQIRPPIHDAIRHWCQQNEASHPLYPNMSALLEE
ncbi:MAG TPA: ATP-binding protein [Anaerolineae bacterium]|nr:ATP-binding protein [Anaerolineae bacterium]